MCVYVHADVCGGIRITVSLLHVVAPHNATITEVVMNSDVTYTCYADGGPNNSYQWIRLRDDEVVSMTQELTVDNTDLLDGGDYQCIITNADGNVTALTTLNGEI